MTLDEIKERLAARLPLRIVARKSKTTALWECLIEHSFSMDWSTSNALVRWSGKAYSIIGELTINAVKESEHDLEHYSNKHYDVRVFDPLDPDCPIKVDWEHWINVLDSKNPNKFQYRNAPITQASPTVEDLLAERISLFATNDALLEKVQELTRHINGTITYADWYASLPEPWKRIVEAVQRRDDDPELDTDADDEDEE